jgi:hypothetical protein
MFLLNIEILFGKLFRRIKQHISEILMHQKKALFSNCCNFRRQKPKTTKN